MIEIKSELNKINKYINKLENDIRDLKEKLVNL